MKYVYIIIVAIMFLPITIALLILASPYLIWEYFYFKGEDFLKIKRKLDNYVRECNEMNAHIESLKSVYVDFNQVEQGRAEVNDSSAWNFQRKELSKYEKSKDTHNCSSTVCRNARNQPFKYLCKYFNIKPTEENLGVFEETLNQFLAAKNGVEILKGKRETLLKSLKNQVPFVIRVFRKKKLERELGFEPVDFSDAYVPVYKFQYISAGGNSSMETKVVLDTDNLESFINYLADIVKFRKSAAGQRALMTANLRQKIKERDHFTCKKCQNNLNREPNLLLEIDHIIPVSKGGLTAEDNLQTLCWKCNRSKGAKV